MFTACPELWPSPWPGAPSIERLVIGDARLLGRLRDAVDVGAEAMTGLPEPQVATHAVGMPAMPRSTVKPFFLAGGRSGTATSRTPGSPARRS